jgi:integrase
MGQGLAEANPLFGIAKFGERPRERVLSDSELRLVWNAAGDDHFGTIIKLLMLTGQRADEIASLRWSEIGGDAITLPSERTKNHRAHVVPLAGLALDILRAQPRRANDDGVLRDLVFGVGQRGFSGWAAFGPHIIEAVLNHVTGSRSAVSRIYNRRTYEPEKRRALDLWGSHITTLANGGASNLLPVRVPT